MRTATSIVVAAVLCGTATTAAANEIPTPITSSQFTTVAGGEVIVEAERGELNRGVVIGLVRAPQADVVAIVADTENHELWFPDTVESTEVENNGDTDLSTGVTAVPLLRDRTWTLRGHHTRPRYNGIQCDLLEYEYVEGGGNMDDLFGYWLICPYEGNTVVKYVINADLGVWLPNAVVTWAQRRMLPGIIEGIQTRWQTLHP
ncbi:MAG: hypothetical protein H6698_08390 [Myxococcales bacterium]|nr:hypothetical protein [Myxococcales bacterium]MCB9520147.1 hypothetical protein [Myxococcales bacterium]MCB9531231.1 hypothetical protein [Myxococcales bacterium]MCB9534308.1 hypothetical protein [Myxococcales bacterium]